MTKIISWNVNGIRAVARKGFLKWFRRASPDIMCIQETRAKPDQLKKALREPKGYYAYFSPAKKRGYGGVTVYSKEEPLKIENKLGSRRFDSEGRILKLTYSDFILINVYMPHGGRQKENLKYKLRVYSNLLTYLRKLKNKRAVITGDFNIAHKEIDLARPKQNKNNIMFTKEERRKIDRLVKLGFVDTFRKLHKDTRKYTWWPFVFVKAREKNIGWRLDYFFVSRKLLSKLKKATILTTVKGSDHCPVGLELNK